MTNTVLHITFDIYILQSWKHDCVSNKTNNTSAYIMPIGKKTVKTSLT